MTIYNDKNFLKAFNRDDIFESNGLNLTLKRDKCLNPYMCQKYQDIDNTVLGDLSDKHPGYSIKCSVSDELLRFCAINGFLVKPRVNYKMTLGNWSIDSLKSSNVRRKFRKSIRVFQVSDYLDLNGLSDEEWKFVANSTKKYSVENLINKDNFLSLINNQFTLRFRTCYKSDVLAGLVILLKYGDVVYYLWGAGEVTSILVNTLQDVGDVLEVRTFDFEGSSIRGVENFYSQFEPQLEIYAEIFFTGTESSVKRIFKRVLERL